MEHQDLIVGLIFLVVGATIFLVRLLPLQKRRRSFAPLLSIPDTSIIVPARNEAHNLPRLLTSLKTMEPAPLEVIVVNDHSTDETRAVAEAHGVQVVDAPEKPSDWIGKSWACQVGAQLAKGEILLFTDADTEHSRDSLACSIAQLRGEGLGLVSVVPTHILKAFWERLQGVFQLLLLIATRAGEGRLDASTSRRYAIGQYLLFTRQAYEAIDGHNSVRGILAEDLALARNTAQKGFGVGILMAPGLMRVRMYPEGVWAFVAGWRRSFRDGVSTAGARASMEVVLVVGWLLGAFIGLVGAFALDAPGWELAFWAVSYGMSAFFIAHQQRHLGPFSWGSALLYPIFLSLFVWVTLLSLFDALRGAPVRWRGRSFKLPRGE